MPIIRLHNRGFEWNIETIIVILAVLVAAVLFFIILKQRIGGLFQT